VLCDKLLCCKQSLRRCHHIDAGAWTPQRWQTQKAYSMSKLRSELSLFLSRKVFWAACMPDCLTKEGPKSCCWKLKSKAGLCPTPAHDTTLKLQSILCDSMLHAYEDAVFSSQGCVFYAVLNQGLWNQAPRFISNAARCLSRHVHKKSRCTSCAPDSSSV